MVFPRWISEEFLLSPHLRTPKTFALYLFSTEKREKEALFSIRIALVIVDSDVESIARLDQVSTDSKIFSNDVNDNNLHFLSQLLLCVYIFFTLILCVQ